MEAAFVMERRKTMSKLPISVCIIAKNEEEHIRECLRRLKPYGFEIVVADTGSMDHTKQAAFEYADKVLDFLWTDDFSAARNFCAANASNNDILVIDCDEYIEKCDTKGLMELAETYPDMMGVMQIKSIVKRPDGLTSYIQDTVPRFYNRDYFTYNKPIHEQIVPLKTGGATTEQNFLLPIEIFHYGYALTPDKMRVKQERNLQLLHRQLETEGGSPYLYYQIGQSELILKNYERAANAYERGLACGADCGLLYVQSMIEGLARAYVLTGRAQEALVLMDRYETDCDSARYLFYHAGVLSENNQPLKALVKYVKATMMPDTDTLGDELLYCYEHIIELYHRFGEDELSDVFRRKYEECRQMRVLEK